MKKTVVIQRLKSIKSKLAEFGVVSLGLFGSTVREENRSDSDIDILIDFDTNKETYFNFISVCNILEDLFRRNKLDVVTRKGLSPYIGKTILNEVEYV